MPSGAGRSSVGWRIHGGSAGRDTGVPPRTPGVRATPPCNLLPLDGVQNTKSKRLTVLSGTEIAVVMGIAGTDPAGTTGEGK